MNQEEYKSELALLESDYKAKRRSVMIKYASANNPYNMGDKVTDHVGTIIIESLGYFLNEKKPSVIYYGAELKKDGTPKVNGSKRNVYQNNLK